MIFCACSLRNPTKCDTLRLKTMANQVFSSNGNNNITYHNPQIDPSDISITNLNQHPPIWTSNLSAFDLQPDLTRKSKFANPAISEVTSIKTSIGSKPTSAYVNVRNTSKILKVLRSRFRTQFKQDVHSGFNGKRRTVMSPLRVHRLTRNIRSQGSSRWHRHMRFRVWIEGGSNVLSLEFESEVEAVSNTAEFEVYYI